MQDFGPNRFPRDDRRRVLSLCHRLAWGLGLLALLSGCQGLFSERNTGQDASFQHLVGQRPSADSPARHGALWYRIEANSHRLLVHIRLFDPPDRTAFFLPAEWAGHADYAEAIEIRGAHTSTGSTPYTIDRGAGRVDVKSDDARWIQLDYAVQLTHRGDEFGRFHPRFVDELLFAYGPAFLLLPSEQIIRAMRDIPVEVHAPADWKMLSTWTHLKSTPSARRSRATVHGFLAETPAALRDAFLTGGPDIQIQHPLKAPQKNHPPPETARAQPTHPSPITVGFDPALRVDQAEFSRHIAHILRAYRARFGDLGPVTAFVRQVPTGAQERRGVGRRGGFVVELAGHLPARQGHHRVPGTPQAPPPQPLDAQTLLLLAHEAFHLWNGHYLTPQAAWEPQTRWFKEGVTHYMAIKTLAELGLLGRDAVLNELAKSAEFYLQNPAADPRTAGQANATDHARLPYDRGVLLALALDTFLSERSRGQVGLADWVAWLLAQMAAHQQDYTAAHLRAAFVEVAARIEAPNQPGLAEAAAAFWEHHVGPGTPLQPAEIFQRAGLHWLGPAPRNQRRLLPLKRPDSPLTRLFPSLQIAHPQSTQPAPKNHD